MRAATAMARRDGLDAVTVRAVAGALDVTPMALYRHVGSAAGLRLATLDAILLQVRTPVEGSSAVEQLRAFATTARAVLRRYPGVAEAVLTSWPQLLQGCRLMEWLLVVAASVTARNDGQVDIANGVFTLVLLQVMTERAALDGGPGHTPAMVDAHPERFPHLVARQREYARLATERRFRVGLDALLARLIRDGSAAVRAG